MLASSCSRGNKRVLTFFYMVHKCSGEVRIWGSTLTVQGTSSHIVLFDRAREEPTVRMEWCNFFFFFRLLFSRVSAPDNRFSDHFLNWFPLLRSVSTCGHMRHHIKRTLRIPSVTRLQYYTRCWDVAVQRGSCTGHWAWLRGSPLVLCGWLGALPCGPPGCAAPPWNWVSGLGQFSLAQLSLVLPGAGMVMVVGDGKW